MDKRSMVISVLEDMGYQPRVDSDGDVLFRFQMKHLSCARHPTGGKSLPRGHAAAVLRDERRRGDQGPHSLQQLTREVRLAKIYIDTNLTEVTASCEFFYSDEASLRLQLEHSLVILGRVRSVFRQALVEFEE